MELKSDVLRTEELEVVVGNNEAGSDIKKFYDIAAHNSARFDMGIVDLLDKNADVRQDNSKRGCITNRTTTTRGELR